jgi:5,10-methylenetetrahydrofolate reductase
LAFDGPVYAGVIVLGSASMAAKLSTNIPELAVPESITDRLSRDPDAGVEIACETVDALRRSGALDGVHLVPVARYREMSARLERRA